MRSLVLLLVLALVGAACAALPAGPQDVKITVKAGRNIKAGDFLGLVKGDPYCKVKLLGISKQTKEVSTTSEPQWNEALPKWSGVYPGNRVYVSVYDRDTSIFAGDDDLMGTGSMLVSAATEGGKPVEKWIAVKDDKGKQTGEVLISLTYGKLEAAAPKPKPKPVAAPKPKPSTAAKPHAVPAVPKEGKASGASGPLTVRVVSASGVENNDLFGLGKSDPYVKVTVTGVKRETKHKKDTSDPVWNELLPAWSSVYPSNRVYIDLIDQDDSIFSGADDFIGRGEVVVSALTKGQWTQKTVVAKDEDGKERGRVTLKLKWEPTETKKKEDAKTATGGAGKAGGAGKVGGSVSIGGSKASASVSIGGSKVGGSVSIGGSKGGGLGGLGDLGKKVDSAIGGLSSTLGKLGITVGGGATLSGSLSVGIGGKGSLPPQPQPSNDPQPSRGPVPSATPGPYDAHPGDGLGENSDISCGYGGDNCCKTCCPCGPYGTDGYYKCCGCYYPYVYFCDMNAIQEWEAANPDRKANVQQGH